MNDFSREQTNNFSRERAKRNDRAHRDTSIQNPRRDLYVKEQASERANDRAPLELGGSTTAAFYAGSLYFKEAIKIKMELLGTMKSYLVRKNEISIGDISLQSSKFKMTKYAVPGAIFSPSFQQN